MSEHAVSLRPIEPSDWRAVHRWACLAQVCRFQPWGPNTEEETREFVHGSVEAWSATPQSRYPWVARIADEVVGMGELHVRSRDHHQGELSYIVHPSVWRQGVATEIGRRLLAYGFGALGFHRVYATCDPRNAASARVLTKLGLTLEGRLRHTQLIRDGWRDSLVFGVLADEWPTSGPRRGSSAR